MIPFKEFNVIGSRVINLQKPCKKDLEWLYITKNLKGKEIGEIYGENRSTITRWFKKWDIKKRSELPTELALKKLYLVDKLSVEEIADIYNFKTSESIRRWLRKFKIPIRTREENCMLKYGVKNISQAEEVKEKRKETNIDIYGVENVSQVEEFKEKKKQTCLKKFGVENASQAQECKDKSKKTCLEKYGTEYVLQADEVKEKSEKTCLEKYGVKHHTQTKEVQDKKRQTCLKKFGVENVSQVGEFQEKSKQTCLKKFGVENASQADEIKEKKKETYLKNYGRHPKQCEEVQKKYEKTCFEKHGVKNIGQKHIKNFEIWDNQKLFQDWIIETYNELGRKLTSGDLNDYFNLTRGSSVLRLKELPEEYNKYYKIKGSYFEFRVEDWIKQNITTVYERNKRYDFMRNNNGNMMQLDFYFPSLKIAVEVNDNWSHSIEFKIERRGMKPEEALNYEQTKTDLCKAQGIKLIHLWEDDFDNIDTVLKPILDADKK
ncbi:MAG: hypothetical protein LBV42_05650 [Methanobrevibacter sp.]|jgi:hypothetical protein|nr:hypothetical protein [Methanobrevibacter sp.]